MIAMSVAEFLDIVDGFLSGEADFHALRSFVFRPYESEADVEVAEDLEEILSIVAPYVEYEEAHGDRKRFVRIRRMRALLPGPAPGTRCVLGLEFDRVRELASKVRQGAISEAIFRDQLLKLSPGQFDVQLLMTWALLHETEGDVKPELLPGP